METVAGPVYIVVLCQDDRELWGEVAAKVAETYENHQQIAPWAWMVSTSQTTEAISKKLFPDKGERGQRELHIVSPIGSYFGFHNRELWEWIDNPELEPWWRR